MNIEIYRAEIDAGLEESISSNASVAYSSLAVPYSPSAKEMEKVKSLILVTGGKSNPDQFDLYYLNSVLVSSGWNKNDDVFDIGETWAARKTPEDKQFNFMHDESDIIGHITANIAIDATGAEISDEIELENLPENFDIITSAVLYNSWSDPERQERMKTIIEEIEAGKWFVSMECLFMGFDYAAVTPTGDHKVIARNEDSAFLTKHLRAYGGGGEFEGYKLGRLLRNIAFSGKGLVNNPANPKSVILKNDPFHGSKAYSITDFSIRENVVMANEDNQQGKVDLLQSELKQAKEDTENLKAEMEIKKTEEIQLQVDAFEVQIAEKDEEISERDVKLNEQEALLAGLEEKLVEKDEKLSEALSKIEANESEAKLMARKTALVEAGIGEDTIEETLKKFADTEDAVFDEIVALLLKTQSEDTEEASEETTEVEAEVTEEIAADVDEDETTADAEDLDGVEEEEEVTMVDAGDDGLDEARTSASQWLATNVLHTTAGLNE
jgi:hypothetical protein